MTVFRCWVGVIGTAISLASPVNAAHAERLMRVADPAQSQAGDSQAQLQAKHDVLPDTRGTGPYPALKEENPSLPDHVIYRPEHLSQLGATKLGRGDPRAARTFVGKQCGLCTDGAWQVERKNSLQ